MENEASPTEKKVRRTSVLVGLALGVLLFALDQTVVGTSLPKVVADIGGFEHFSWVFTSYMLTSTVMVPISGKVSDLIGRRKVFLAGMLTFLIGSVLCALSGELDFLGISAMTQLIIFRGLQGLGGGMIFPVALATVADLYAPAERGKIQGAMGAVWGFASVVGPFVGGWIVDYLDLFGIASWRWVFLVNIPVGITAIAVVAVSFPRLKVKGAQPIDYLGAGLITATLVPLLLITVWGGDTYEWTSPEILGLGVFSFLSLGAFLFRESRAKDPVIPLSLFKEPVFTISGIASFLMGMSMFGVISFMPTYFQGVVGLSATYSGAVLLPLTTTMVIGSVVSGILLKRYGYKVFAVLGSIITAMGLFMLSNLGVNPPVWLAVFEMMWVGLGMGLTMQTFVVAVQNVIEKRFVGTATSTLMLVRSLGATLGITLLGTVLNREFRSGIDSRLSPQAIESLLRNPFINGKKDRLPQLLLDKDVVSRMPLDVVDGIKEAFSGAVSTIFLISTAIALVAFVFVVFLRSVPLKSASEYHGSAGEHSLEGIHPD